MNELITILTKGPTSGAPPNGGLAAHAAADGLLDVAYVEADSPLGPLLLAASPKGLVRVAYLQGTKTDAVLAQIAADVSPRVLRAPSRLDEVRRELEEYFAGRRQRFDAPVDWSRLSGFRRDILRRTARIPYGRVQTYRDVAEASGRPGAARAAGGALGSNPTPIVVPCHRVVAAGGRLGGYTGGVEKKEFLLRLEGVSL